MRALLYVATAVAALAGCAAVSPETRAEEGVYLALLTVDAAQTANIAATPNVEERESSWIIGREPSRRSVYAYMGTVAVLHVAAGAFMDARDWPRWIRRTFEAVTIGDEAACVRGNYQLGIATHF